MFSYYPTTTGHSMSLFKAVLHASQSLCHELNVFIGLTNMYCVNDKNMTDAQIIVNNRLHILRNSGTKQAYNY